MRKALTWRCLLLSILSLAALDCRQPSPGPSALDELRALAGEDQTMRGAEETDPQKTYDADQAHRRRVFELIAAGRIASAEEKFLAALLLQHTPAMVCGGTMTSESRENYLLAHFLASASAEAGYRPARRMTAMTLDRYLWMCGLPQKYGTNFNIDKKTGRPDLEPLDPATTDEERARWDVEPLRVLRGEAKKD